MPALLHRICLKGIELSMRCLRRLVDFYNPTYQLSYPYQENRSRSPREPCDCRNTKANVRLSFQISSILSNVEESCSVFISNIKAIPELYKRATASKALMGISKVVAINSTVLLGVAYSLRRRAPWPVLVPLVQASAIGFLVAVSALPSLNFVGLFRKSRDGYFPWWSHVLHFWYMSMAKGYVYARRKQTSEPAYTEVSNGLYVGGWPFQPSDVPPGNPAIVDCTCELPRSECVRDLPYLCIPTWDSRAPLAKDIQEAVQWAADKKNRENRPIFVHCAFGHGRSVTVMCALLLALKVVESLEAARKLIKDRRPRIHMNELQMQSFEIWQKQHHS
ncbi:hypothetical protein GOP47_0009195 [Adiantum capillus-veneris]|uniref:Tyrosine specific protein phosphatases domain-containing protein n=1 Tax=Adiantum capillus-veneris TaxID=13818 RepID=A0A9D4UWG0_ADICA|nr:hypothetical protein GOP47_0009195 [Adiantum capillus-veneris]